MPGEHCNDDVISDPLENFRINVFNVTVDSVVNTLQDRFESIDGEFYADIALLDPRNFSSLKLEEIKAPIFESLTSKLEVFDRNVTAENLRTELKALISDWENLRRSPLDEYRLDTRHEEADDDDTPERDAKSIKKHSCKNCAITGAYPL